MTEQKTFDPELAARQVQHGRRLGDQTVRIVRSSAFRRRGPGVLVATEEAHAPASGVPRLVDKVKRLLFGAPLPSDEAHHERLTKVKALAVLSSDALSSSAYATEQILIVLVAGGAAALGFVPWIALAIVLLLAIVVFSYRQTIKAYPQGGGSYIVTKDNLGVWPALIAAASLMVGYVLTVAVSVSAGVAALTSAAPMLLPWAAPIALVMVGLLTIVNLRGVRESGTIFAAPTYLFVATAFGMIVWGVFRIVTGAGPAAEVAGDPTALPVVEPLTAFLVLRAFAQGCAALTGVEAISDGVPAFYPPEWKNARATLTWMAILLGGLFLGITYLAFHFEVLPREGETVLSQVNRAVFGSDTTLYYVFQAAAMMILVLAANTCYSDFPRLSFFLARDHFMPHQFSFRGDRLAFSTGIAVLGLLSAMLIVAFNARTEALIPLYAVSVFISFTFSQASMCVRWWRRREPGWRRSLPINAIGAATTGLVALVVGVTQFTHGAWITMLLIPFVVMNMWAISRHYRVVSEQIALPDDTRIRPLGQRVPIIAPVPGLNRAVAQTMSVLSGLSQNVVAVHVSDDPQAAAELRQQWTRQVPGVRLVILESPYREIVEPLLAYLDAVQQQCGNTPIIVVLSEHVPRHLHEFPLHNQTALSLKARLFFRPNTIVMDVPFHLAR
ncbi:MAG TPA: APC family permease [Chloroflexota bacterium]